MILPATRNPAQSSSLARPHLLLAFSLLCSSAFLAGCVGSVIGKPAAGAATSPAISLSSTATSVRLQTTCTFSASQSGSAITGGTWGVLGGTSNGSIDAGGVYQAPAALPNPSSATLVYTFDGTTTSTIIALLNPQPSLTSASPSVLPQGPATVVVLGSGFLPSSKILVNQAAVATTFIDSTHVSAAIPAPAIGGSQTLIAVQNPSPGASTSNTLALSTSAPAFTVTPAILSGGPVTITATTAGLPANATLLLDGKLLTTVSISAGSIQATGFLPPWKSGSSVVTLVAGSAGAPTQQVTLPIQATAVSYDVAARFTTQAAFGPRPDVVQHVQQIGLAAYIDEQFALPGVDYTNIWPSPRTTYQRAVTTGSTLLRARVAWSLQTFLTNQGTPMQSSTVPYEAMLEKDSSGNFRDLLTDLASDPSMGAFLNLAGNAAPADPAQHPNQNFGRELMQLFTLGLNLLSDDGTLKLDAGGNPIPTYTQNQVVDISRALTGWNFAPTVNPAFTAYGVDYTQPLIPVESQHDQGAKTIVGSVTIPAGQGIVLDRKTVLDTIFQHPNLPPHLSRILIQRLVKSAPTPAYVARMSKVFEDDGTGVRGNLAALVRAILLDPEARAGDTTPQDDDGFLQEPLIAQLFQTSITQTPISDAETDYYPNQIGENWWFTPTVFGFYSPTYIIPGTQINSPEFQVYNNQTAVIRDSYTWGIVSQSLAGYEFNNTSWLYSNFTTVPDLLDALDHLAFHGQMPAAEKSTILSYCQGMDQANLPLQFQSAIFLAINSDPFTVSH